MTQEDKELLLKDLCARLPYGVICKWEDNGYSGGGKLIDVCKVKTSKGYIYWDCYFEDENDDIPIEIVKPYLRSMQSMTEEERTEYFLIKHRDNDRDDNIILLDEASTLIDWLNSHHFDYRSLIPMGLALEAPEGMYN